MKIVGYTYDADTHCVDCTEKYIAAGYNIEVKDVAADYDDYQDSEGNPIHPIFDTDEAGDSPDHCGNCGKYLDTSWTGSTMDYAAEALSEYVWGRMAENEHPGNPEVLDIWCEKLEWTVGMVYHQELTLELYKRTRQFERDHG